ncbi:MAG: endonuclease/exonuclease/phosphatase family protein [Chloroflexi bacterium]|nr:endonuclease/exonuclease/phosphatase family protein [Chloroflexota bacterium]
MTRIVSYNILAGGYSLRENGASRAQQLTKIIRSVQPDIIGLVEATHPSIKEKPMVIEEIAEELGMQLTMGGDATHKHDYQLALLTRLPIVYTKIHPRPGLLTKPLLEVCVEEANGERLTVFVTHLSAAFNQGWAGAHIRTREVHEILRIMEPQRQQGIPHLLMGDFNSLAPDDNFKASSLLRYIVDLDQYRRDHKLVDGHPYMNGVVPPQLRFLKPILRTIPRSKILTTLFDAAASLYAPRGCIRVLREAGYIDSYRHLHPDSLGFTCPASAPAGRIDYIFASPTLVQRLEACYEITEGDGLPGDQASDHLAITATFGLPVQPAKSPSATGQSSTELDSAATH